MKNTYLAGAAALALAAGTAYADGHLAFAPGSGDFSWDSYEALKSMDLSGETVSVFGPWLGPDKELVESVIAYFEEATGANVEYSGSDSFEQQIRIDTEAGSPPNVAVFPQPGLAADLAAKGLLVPLADGTADWVRENYAAGQSWVDLGTYADENGADQLYGFFYKVDVKSLVWYSPENFEDAGYDVPETMEDLKALTDQIVADGETPWCIGLGSGGATGWPATDWVEDLMLRTQSPADYDAWVANDLKFTDPKVVGAIEEFGAFARNDAYVAGGAGAVASTDFRDAPKGLFASPPQCYMHRQASFIPAFFPEGTVVGEDADFFYFPAYAGKDLGKPVLGAGTLFAITKDSKGTRAFMEYLQSEIAHEIWMAQKGFLTPHNGVNTGVFTDPTVAKMNDILLNADTFRFDGSDLMPGAIGAGVFWTGMVDYAGGKDAAAVAADIQSTWDNLN
ncbi:alpha-glucoside ABC transporter substrate-binding protein [Actibacterium mucosum KCTC 23349]|uniref:Alpha-glucoside ABC transporter substrate-binding protein n=1 Tax=Actibacterium mucosum KCTC 23349 TaxID=1454373 RepID=A0A037ZIQ8_9RHOB|nr:ABC transporter substrate-binding protein [Actibacterium mucosum]KAJ55402.1 alpha-glucoside ABC transporter substrate-binding protein [Actibacterium mucosum KCTC 23349]